MDPLQEVIDGIMGKTMKLSKEKDSKLKKSQKKWRRKANDLYDIIKIEKLSTAALTVEWLPEFELEQGGENSISYLLHGTENLTTNEKNYLLISKIYLPTDPRGILKSKDKAATDDEESGEKVEIKIEVMEGKITQLIAKMVHLGEVNRARHMPQAPCVAATATCYNQINIFHYPDHSNNETSCRPDLRLMGHKKECYGICWSPTASGFLVSASTDHTVALWDINGMSLEDRILTPITLFKSHTKGVADVSCHHVFRHVFASAGDDKQLMLWDSRFRDAPFFSKVVHTAEVNTVSFNSNAEYYLATGSSDKTVALWDIRQLKKHLFTYNWHDAEVYQVRWSPHHKCVLASGDVSGRILVSDLDQTCCKKEKECPELLFTHRGHTSIISDIAWHPYMPWMFCSISEDKVMQFWQISENYTANTSLYEPPLSQISSPQLSDESSSHSSGNSNADGDSDP